MWAMVRRILDIVICKQFTTFLIQSFHPPILTQAQLHKLAKLQTPSRLLGALAKERFDIPPG